MGSNHVSCTKTQKCNKKKSVNVTQVSHMESMHTFELSVPQAFFPVYAIFWKVFILYKYLISLILKHS